MIIPWLVISLWYPELTMTIPWLMNHVHNVMYWWLYTLVLSPLSQYHWQAWHPLSLRKTISTTTIIMICTIVVCKDITIRRTYRGSSGCGRAPSLLLGIWKKCKNLAGWTNLLANYIHVMNFLESLLVVLVVRIDYRWGTEEATGN